jgi:hypothetical protein
MKTWQQGRFFTDEFIGNNSWNGREHDILVRNDNRGERFFDIAYISGIDLQTDGRGMTYLDYDLDGDLDVIVVGHRQQAILLRNDYGHTHNWLHVALSGTRSNRQAIGARITVRTGEERQIREVRAGGGFLQSHSVPQAFGLGEATHVDELIVQWPSGIQQTFHDVPANQLFRIVESAEAAAVPGEAQRRAKSN